ncbi:PD40 domain-containing protein [Alloacidobacterium dinghuense]|uniref:PD40 domain-containing protein n=1 Tax=Alloacidobacterium dinghuense TaxID=2763107 RepID=A0A7G8BJM0_9BACT|nr:PD40 domain-containing protein [Alloacidobacterium dinghuense]
MKCSLYQDFGCGKLMWTADGRSIIFASDKDALPALFRVSARGGPVQRELIFPALGSFTKDGLRFVYSEQTSVDPPAIWRADLDAAGGRTLEVKKVIGTQYPELDAQPSPDGTRLVWMSMRAGHEEIWTSDASGRDPVQLTHVERHSGTPRWSPDGKWVAFDTYLPHGPQIFVIDAEGRNLHAITSGADENCVPSWSPRRQIHLLRIEPHRSVASMETFPGERHRDAVDEKWWLRPAGILRWQRGVLLAVL